MARSFYYTIYSQAVCNNTLTADFAADTAADKGTDYSATDTVADNKADLPED